ncbi:MAG: endo-1,4-beta-xylanase, partial [Myxococcota bacterium]|nr:endo-1,4-beta-xylanase [Myxococcota bacterium]
MLSLVPLLGACEPAKVAAPTGGMSDTAIGGEPDTGEPETGNPDSGPPETGNPDPIDTGPLDTANPWDPDTLAGAGWLRGRAIGAALSTTAFAKDEAYLSLFSENFSSLTPENATKWGLLQSESSTWDFSDAEGMVELAVNQGMAVRGHTLAWHNQLPDWIDDDSMAETFALSVQAHVESVAAWDDGRIETWDVVNEALEDDGSLRDSIWSQDLGSEWVADMFVLAHEQLPHAALFYNDYSIAWLNTKSDAVYAMVEQMLADGVPIDGVGMQVHVSAGSAPEPEDLAENIRRFGDLGLEVHITEMDVQMRDIAGVDDARLFAQARTYHRVVSACLEEPACTSISFWGFTDRYSWIDDHYGADDPLLWDEDLQPKPAHHAVMAALRGEPLPGCGEEFITNGDFEKGTDGWTSSWGNTIEATDRYETWQGVVQDITHLVAEGIPYEASAWVRLDGADSDDVSLTMSIVDETETTWPHIMDTTAYSSGWTELSGTVT